ncbi:hypothetical protein COB55_05820 [Candidatus Wolfebacteria bacterium]|nr:MAG: hypothetical protein COB55_05820 [Candidatus Wolfebacteria bacterium]
MENKTIKSAIGRPHLNPFKKVEIGNILNFLDAIISTLDHKGMEKEHGAVFYVRRRICEQVLNGEIK